MARSALFSQLGRVASQLFQASARASQARIPNATRAVTRRQLLGASMGLGLSACAAQSSAVQQTSGPATHRVAVIGAGLAGLHCAFRLAQAGVDVTVYEANTRIGGRAFTGRTLFGDNSGKLIAELGGEFIASDHTVMHALSREFGILLDERLPSSAGGISEVYWLGGKEIPAQTVTEQLAAVTPALFAALAAADGDASIFRDLDNTTLASFFEQNVPSLKFPELSALLGVAFRVEFGLEPDQQSALNVLYLVGPGQQRGLNSSNSGSLFHAHLGNDTFATQLSIPLLDRIKLNRRLLSIVPNPSSGTANSSQTFTLSFETETASGFVAEAEHVVFAVPFSILRRLDLSALTLSVEKRKLIAQLGYGTHSKLLGAFRTRIWRDQLRSGSVSSDLPLQQVWDSSVGQTESQAPITQGILSNLLGGDAGAKADAVLVSASMAALLSDLNNVFPGVSAAYLAGSAVRMHWPSSAFSRGSAACYRPGQWALRGNEGAREGNLYFCGEHCSVDFQGRMEGAVETGALVAAKILDDLELPLPIALSELLEPKFAVPQPCYDGTTGAALGFLERREQLAI